MHNTDKGEKAYQAALDKLTSEDRQRFIDGDFVDTDGFPDAYAEPEPLTQPAFDKVKTLVAVLIMLAAVLFWIVGILALWPFMPKKDTCLKYYDGNVVCELYPVPVDPAEVLKPIP